MVRVVLGLLVVAVIPLAVSFVLIGRIADVAQNFSSHRVERLLPHMERAQERYRELIRAKKELNEPKDEALLAELAAMGEEVRTAARVADAGGALPTSYRNGFIILVGGVVVLVTAAGLVLAIRIGRRIELLASAAERIGVGDLSTRVQLVGGDELTFLSRAFNRMTDRLEQDREKIEYLQRIGAWQEVARRLAHEIKNPLTPIRLAVQQMVSTYNGDDARFKKQLKDTEEIVNEEIQNLQRLVDAFTLLGRLPRVEPKPLDLEEVASDLEKDPAVTECLRRGKTAGSVNVRADRLLLKRVLINLIENGHHAGMVAGKPGVVELSWSADRDQKRVLITVDDEGPGLPDELHRKVFEPYYTTKETGSGLGLAIAKKIAIDHGGSLEVSSQRAPTGGARFVLSLPLA
jgi:nitrogen fixation/metabolism regulation signal transduction histidine kinase